MRRSEAAAPRRFPRRFHDRLGAPIPGYRDVLRLMLDGGFRDRADPAAVAARVPRAPAGTGVPRVRDGAAVTWVGHASCVLQVAGRVFLTDPVWSDRLPGGTRRVTPPGVAWETLPRVDGVLVSHAHYDHLDAPTLKRLPRATPCYVPANLGAWFRRRGFTHVTELDWWEGVSDGDVRVDLVPAQHWSQRGPWDRNATLWGGWVVTGGGARVYFAGDTGYTPWFREIGRRFPGIDVAILPIGAYAPRWFMRPVHMTPEEAVQAYRDVGARRLVPMHWGTFVLTREPLLEPLERLHAAWAHENLPRADLWDLALGETRAADTGDA